ncbi:MAG: hypothetical protein D6705_12550 [Deltaproteobacteria bacterium]|nr:MAG: hypothetical protein D6705_12550 [Deltaproteobacteria bacterium]
MPRPHDSTTILSLLVLVAACDSKRDERDEKPNADGAAQRIEAAVENEVQKAEREFGLDSKTLRKRTCDLLTAEMVADGFGLNASDLEQTKIVGCGYTWKGNEEVVEARILMPQVHASTAAAKKWFEGATANRTKEELAAQMDRITKKAQEHEKIDTKSKKRTTKKVGGLMKMAIPEEGISYENLPGIGDEARIASNDGTAIVRVGNVTFRLSAYRCKEKPKVDIVSTDPKKLMARTMEIEHKWVAETMDARRKGVAMLGPKVVEKLKTL